MKRGLKISGPLGLQREETPDGLFILGKGSEHVHLVTQIQTWYLSIADMENRGEQ